MRDNFSIVNLTKMKMSEIALPAACLSGRQGRQAFFSIKEDILGKKYSLSLAFIGKEKMRELNNKYRNKNEITNILSFSLSKTEGEILICPTVVKKETKKFGKTYIQLLQFLVIHGMLHLKGMEHSSRMEEAERKYLSRLSASGRY